MVAYIFPRIDRKYYDIEDYERILSSSLKKEKVPPVPGKVAELEWTRSSSVLPISRERKADPK